MKIPYTPSLSKKEIFANISKIPTSQFPYYDSIIKSFEFPEYESWQKIQYLSPFNEMSKEKGFSLFHFFRHMNSEKTPFSQENGAHFFWQKLPHYERFFHEFSNSFCKKHFKEGTTEQQKILQRRILRGLEEEAISSSLLEGANTTRSNARMLIKENIQPRTEGEKMILDNYETISWIEAEGKNESMSIDFLLKVQKNITKRTLDKKKIGRIRTNKDDVCVKSPSEKLIHTPPSESFLKKSLQVLVDFANDKEEKRVFFHPILKAIILHFMLGYLHPFCDGNGRTARAIFYWYLLKNGFANIGFLPISTEIGKNRKIYDNSFIFTEQEKGNLTFSIDAMVRILEKSKDEYYQYLEDEEKKIAQKERIQKERYMDDLNNRQIEVLLYFERYPEEKTDFKRHMILQGITYKTSRNDLIGLEEKGLLFSKTVSNKKIFFPA